MCGLLVWHAFVVCVCQLTFSVPVCVCVCSGLYGWGPPYGTGGYVNILSLNRTEAYATLQQMKSDLCVTGMGGGARVGHACGPGLSLSS